MKDSAFLVESYLKELSKQYKVRYCINYFSKKGTSLKGRFLHEDPMNTFEEILLFLENKKTNKMNRVIQGYQQFNDHRMSGRNRSNSIYEVSLYWKIPKNFPEEIESYSGNPTKGIFRIFGIFDISENALTELYDAETYRFSNEEAYKNYTYAPGLIRDCLVSGNRENIEFISYVNRRRE